jgi:CRP-like cAMP-binding protein
MTDQLYKFINQYLKLTDEEFNAILSIAKENSIKKKEHLVRANELCRKVVFFTEGYFRFYHSKNDGTEITSDFYFSPNFVTSYTSYLTDMPSVVSVQAMENMNVLTFEKSDLYSLFSEYHNIEKLGRLIAENVAINSEMHLFMLLNQPAEERYRNLLSEYPHFIKEIPLQYIASYLGITQETLSRIRAKQGS